MMHDLFLVGDEVLEDGLYLFLVLRRDGFFQFFDQVDDGQYLSEGSG